MPVNLNLSAVESVDFKTLTFTDTTADWGVGTNINFTDVRYAEMYVGIKGALYGPVVITETFTNATTQSNLVFSITTQNLGLSTETFDDGLQEYYYGVSNNSSPNTITRDIWNLDTTYTLPLGTTENKIPFEIDVANEVRSYALIVTISLTNEDLAVNPKISFTVNYGDNTRETVTQAVPKDGTTNTYTLTINVDRTKTVTSVSGLLLDEDRTNLTGRAGSITSVMLNESDLNLFSVVKRGLVAEKAKQKNNQDLIVLGDQILCGRKEFARHERAIVRDMSLRAITKGAAQGLASNIESIINFLNEDC